jgi:tRNA-Thr(GGU) m(6)t(6)A37 methyltransferase TsaA
MSFELEPIGFVVSPYRGRGDAPRQGRLSPAESEIVIREEYLPGLSDLGKYPHLIVLSWFDRADRSVLKAIPPHLGIEQGVFATRSPDRPNPVGLGVVDLVKIDGPRLLVRGLDSIDGTPVIDIKPYITEIDCVRD